MDDPAWSGWAKGYSSVKIVSEFIFALVLFGLTLPLVIICAVLVKLTSRGPAFYSQMRVGKNGKVFTLYKLRTMRHNCELRSGPRWSTQHDSRVTLVGRFLRKSHLDELPQLWNVLRGDMNLVGPRPERPEFVAQLAALIPCYRERLLARPGLTGLAQVQLPADTNLKSVRRKLAYDLYYVCNGGAWLDLRIIASTLLKMLGIPFWVLTRMFRLPRPTVVLRGYRTLCRAAPFGSLSVPVHSPPLVCPDRLDMARPQLVFDATKSA
jgi:lipopolysaccharide/colanic/teichoic acid biosynthesis glycosyltransferase